MLTFIFLVVNKIFCLFKIRIFRHYAGDVIYNINGFLEKNKDTLFQDFKRLMYSSKDPIISKMWPEGAQHITMVTCFFHSSSHN